MIGLVIVLTIAAASTWAGYRLIRAVTRKTEAKPDAIPQARIANPDAAEEVYTKVATAVPRVIEGFAKLVVVMVGVALIVAPWIIGFLAMAFSGIASP